MLHKDPGGSKWPGQLRTPLWWLTLYLEGKALSWHKELASRVILASGRQRERCFRGWREGGAWCPGAQLCCKWAGRLLHGSVKRSLPPGWEGDRVPLGCVFQQSSSHCKYAYPCGYVWETLRPDLDLWAVSKLQPVLWVIWKSGWFSKCAVVPFLYAWLDFPLLGGGGDTGAGIF